MRIGLIADIHGNCIERDGVDDVICLGDVAALGP